MNKHFVIHSNELGVYLGSCMGMGFWSKLDPAGQCEACTFENELQANEYMATWDTQPPKDTKLIPIETKHEQYATLAECMMVGIDHWNPLETIESNTVH
jgi:hypothetical protein